MKCILMLIEKEKHEEMLQGKQKGVKKKKVQNEKNGGSRFQIVYSLMSLRDTIIRLELLSSCYWSLFA